MCKHEPNVVVKVQYRIQLWIDSAIDYDVICKIFLFLQKKWFLSSRHIVFNIYFLGEHQSLDIFYLGGGVLGGVESSKVLGGWTMESPKWFWASLLNLSFFLPFFIGLWLLGNIKIWYCDGNMCVIWASFWYFFIGEYTCERKKNGISWWLLHKIWYCDGNMDTFFLNNKLFSTIIHFICVVL